MIKAKYTIKGVIYDFNKMIANVEHSENKYSLRRVNGRWYFYSTFFNKWMSEVHTELVEEAYKEWLIDYTIHKEILGGEHG